jgi:3-methyladenine DNA glycosylase AlkD
VRTDPIVPARTTLTVDAARSELKRLEDRDRAALLQRFFKTGPGEYADGDVFLGIRVPQLRALVRRCAAIDLGQVETLLHSPAHEEPLLALLLMVRDYGRGDDGKRRQIYRLYLDNTRCINNWDLVDSSAEHIVGAHLQGKNRAPLYRMARSRSLWERRIAIMATYRYIKAGEFADTLRIAEMLLGDPEELIHKATGWMLREVGKRGGIAEEKEFLRRNWPAMPRTVLRYAIERFPEPARRRYLDGTV